MTKEKGFSIYFSPEDLAELREFFQYKVRKEAANWQFPSSDFSNTDFSLKETSELISEARRQLAKAGGERLQLQRQAQEVARVRERISSLPDRDAERLNKQWALESSIQERTEAEEQAEKEASLQAKAYADSRNSGKSGRAYITEEEKSVRDGVVSWIKRQKMRGHFGGQKSLTKK